MWRKNLDFERIVCFFLPLLTKVINLFPYPQKTCPCSSDLASWTRAQFSVTDFGISGWAHWLPGRIAPCYCWRRQGKAPSPSHPPPLTLLFLLHAQHRGPSDHSGHSQELIRKAGSRPTPDLPIRTCISTRPLGDFYALF